MQDILQKYQDRLVNISGRNRSLVLRRLPKKRAFDVAKLDRFFEDFSSKVLSFLYENDGQRFLLLDDPYRDQQQHEKDARDRLQSEYEKKKDNLRESDQQEALDEELQKLAEEYQLQLEQALKKVDARHNSLITISQGINYLSRETTAVEKESGRRELFIGYPFVEGNLFDGTFVRAPLILFPVTLIKDKNKWFLTRSSGTIPRLNKVFIFAHAKANETAPPEMEWELDNNHESMEDMIYKVLGELEKYGINIANNDDSKIQLFQDYTKDNTPSYQLGTLVLKNHLIVGQFPTANSIYDDYNKLLKRELHESAVASLLHSREPANEISTEIVESIKESDCYFISSLDHSQEKAVQTVSHGDHLVIHGPPGTGKSETIANIITNSLANGKRVLMVSQKRAALDVVHNRLAPLHSKMALIHDGSTNKKTFYKHISHSAEAAVEEALRSDPCSVSVKRLGEQVEKILNIFKESWTKLHSVHECGLSLQQLYVKASNITNQESLAHLVVKLRRDNPFQGIKYEDVEIAKQQLSEDGNLDAYLEYRALRKSPLLKFVKRNIDHIDILGAEDVLRNFNADKLLELRENEFFEQVLHRLQEAEYPQSQHYIKKIALEFISEQFPDLLESCCDGRWWSLNYWVYYRRNKKKQQEKDLEKQQRLEQVIELIEDIFALKEEMVVEFKSFNDVFSEEGIGIIIRKLLEHDCYKSAVAEIWKSLDEAENYSELHDRVSRFSETEQILANFVCENISVEKNTPVQFLEQVIQGYLMSCLREHESNLDAHNLVVNGRKYEDISIKMRESLKQKRKQVPNAICSYWSSRFLKDAKNLKQMTYHAGKRSHLWSIRKYVATFTEDILNLFPCWLMGPEALSDIFHLEPGLFDIIIFDEASQMFVENAIPAIFRAKQVVVAGDAKQLRPDDHFVSKVDVDFDEDLDLDVLPATEVESLLDLAVVNFEDVHLNYHYRSQYAELIDFSNYAFYKAQLQVSPNNHTPQQPPIERIKVNGQWSEKRTNLVEAEKVVEIIDNLLRNRKEQETIGVVTFNRTQKNLIQDLLDHQALNDPSFAALYAEERDRQKGNQDVGLFVKNIENVQGDERDIIIFSVGYGPDQHNRVKAQFGSLNREGGANRLNVAVSRAKKKIYLVTSIEPEQLQVDHIKNEGPKFLKAYLEYAKAVSDKNSDKTKLILNSLLDTGVTTIDQDQYDSEFEQQVAEALRSLGYTIKSQIGVSGYRIDLGVYDESSSSFILGIECDGATYHSSKTARERDIHRQAYLESRGWTIARVWSTDWWKYQKGEIKRLVSIIEKEREKHKIKQEHSTIVPESSAKKVEEQNLTETPRLKSVGKGKKQVKVKSSIENSLPKISYGDEVVLSSTEGNVVFHVELEENPHNHHLMKDYERELLGKKLYDEINISGHNYIIDEIKPFKESS